jgi:hypothetical protein
MSTVGGGFGPTASLPLSSRNQCHGCGLRFGRQRRRRGRLSETERRVRPYCCAGRRSCAKGAGAAYLSARKVIALSLIKVGGNEVGIGCRRGGRRDPTMPLALKARCLRWVRRREGQDARAQCRDEDRERKDKRPENVQPRQRRCCQSARSTQGRSGARHGHGRCSASTRA